MAMMAGDLEEEEEQREWSPECVGIEPEAVRSALIALQGIASFFLVRSLAVL